MTEDISPVLADQYDRNERQIDLQIEAVRTMVERGVQLTKLNMIYVGLLLTALSILYQQGGMDLAGVNKVSFTIFSLGGIAISISIIYSIRLMLGGYMHYGPSAQLVSSPKHYGELNQVYEEVFESNDRIMDVKAKQFGKSLSALIAGLSGTSFGLLFLILQIPLEIQVGVVTVMALILGFVTIKILDNRFIELERLGN